MNRLGAREGRESELLLGSKVQGVGRTGKGPAPVPEELSRASLPAPDFEYEGPVWPSGEEVSKTTFAALPAYKPEKTLQFTEGDRPTENGKEKDNETS